MAVVTCGGQSVELAPGETVLEGLLRSGVEVPNSCRAGVCQSCLMRSRKAAVPESAQAGLKDTLRQQGYFLACLCRPQCDLEVESGQGAAIPAMIAGLKPLSETVLEVRVVPEQPLEFRAGQYITLLRADGLSRSYSIANLPGEGHLELHVRRIPDGRMSGWLFDEAEAGTRVAIHGPAGSCFYVPGREEQPLLLAGTGSGLAPLLGILRDAIARGHRGPIWLYHGAVTASGLYLRQELASMGRAHPHVQYRPVVLQGGEAEGLTTGAIDRVVVGEHPKLAGWRTFLCGDPGIVRSLQKTVFLAGTASKDIHADPFLGTPKTATS